MKKIIATQAYNGSMKEKHVGKFLGAPYDFRDPTLKRFLKRVWNPKDKRVLTPKTFGWGWSINFYQLFRLLGLARK